MAETRLESNDTLQEDTAVVEYLTTDTDLIKVANAIRAKSGTTAKLSFPDGFALAISNIPTGAPGGAKETWVLNREVAFPESVLASGQSVTYSISFGARYVNTTTGAIILAPHTSITFRIDLDGVEPFVYQLLYDSDLSSGTNKDDGVLHMSDIDSILTFNTPPTGELLTWLQANGVKQPDDTAIQDTKAVTITSNGTVSVTPDAPYDALKKVDVTVDVASGEVTWYSPVS